MVGNQKLDGQVVKVPKPLVICRKVLQTDNTPRIEVIGVVKKKFLFKTRPQPVVTQPLPPPASASASTNTTSTSTKQTRQPAKAMNSSSVVSC